MIDRYTLKEMGEIWALKHRYQRILDVEIAVVKAQAVLGYIPKEAAKVIEERARFDVDAVAEIESQTRHDLIALLTNVAEYVGEPARYIHLGLTSYDVVDTALALMLKDSLRIIKEKTDGLICLLKDTAIEYKETVMIGRTHGIHAEPISFGLKLALWSAEMMRNRERLERVEGIIGVGKISGAVGTYAHIDPRIEEIACQDLGLLPDPISSQIIQRDRHADYLCTLAIISSSLDKFATEIRSLQRTELGEVEEPFGKGQKGSSAMPHKKNPVLCERISGLSRITRANAQVGLENIALWNERDISHSSAERVVLADSSILVDFMLAEFSRVIKGLVVYPERMLENLNKTKGLIFSEGLMLAIVKKGVSREEAYRLVQTPALLAKEKGSDFKEQILKENGILTILSKMEIEECFSIKSHLKNIDLIFERVFGLK
ncbi:adenylosuccinate lyase [bacterium]|nr:adenylosuccinate lyase [bacterium]MBU1598891.1 adenylosuccinate lyase [bacterium]